MHNYTLKDIEHLTGIRSDTIRMWELRHGILKPKLSGSGRRFYSNSDLLRILNISFLYNHGLKISSIAALSDAELNLKVRNWHFEDKEDSGIRMLTVSMIEYDKQRFEEILNKLIIKSGFVKTFETVVLPFLSRIGILWQTSGANVAMEHFVSNIIRDKVIAATSVIQKKQSEKAKRIMMFLPEGEYHDLGLLYCRYLLTNWGHEVLYLGQSTPIAAIEDALKTWKADFLLTSKITGGELLSDEEKSYLQYLSKLSDTVKVLLTGRYAGINKRYVSAKVKTVSSLNELEKLFKPRP